MITIKTMKQIATAKTISSFRSGGTLQRSPAFSECDRQRTGQLQMLKQERRRQWLNQVWQNRQSN